MPQQYKSILIASAALAGLLMSVSAHGGDALKFSPSELEVLYKATGLTERGGKVLDDCGQPVQPDTEVVDLNGDGQPEVFVQVGGSCYGAAGAQLTLLIKDKLGHWQSNLGFPAGGYKLLSTKNKGYPDIEIGGPGFCFPVWRWNGTQYAIHKRCDR
jgi:hypothetical protein